MRRCIAAIVLVIAGTLPAAAQDEDDKGFLKLNDLDLRLHTDDEKFSMTFSGMLDLEYYAAGDVVPPGLFFENDSILNERLTLFIETLLGENVYFFIQARADQGFDPMEADGFEVRLDEAFGRFTHAFDGWTASVQAGSFATPVGNFVPRHDSMKNPFVRAPLVYDYVTSVADANVPGGNSNFIGRRATSPKPTGAWVPMIWGPVYGTGAMAFVSAGKFDYRLALTNAAPCERPDEWDWSSGDSKTLAVSTRLGWNPIIGLKVGLNYAKGPFLAESVESALPSGKDRADFPQRLFGIDAEYSFEHFVFFAELFRTSWDVPTVTGPVDALGWYIEGKYSFTHKYYAAIRINQITFGEIDNGTGGKTEWDWTQTRIEIGGGARFYENLLAKLEYEINTSGGPSLSDNMASLSVTVGF